MRCNIIDPILLTDQHLIAERREILMIPPLFDKRMKKRGIGGVAKNIPEEYKLGRGHMLFWMNKGRYLSERYEKLTYEMEQRGFRPDRNIRYDLSPDSDKISVDYQPTDNDFKIITDRIAEKIRLKPSFYRYVGEKIDPEMFIENMIWEVF